MKETLKHSLKISGISKPISVLGLGTSSYRLANKESAFEMLDSFVEHGGTLIDTARAYSGGDSEKVIGVWAKTRGVREKVVIITKGGHGPDGVLPAENGDILIEQELAQSLESLETDYIDLYLLHRDNPRLPVVKIMETLNEVLNQGRVHAFGASNWEYDRVDAANEYAYKYGLKGFSAISNNSSLAVPTGSFYPGLVSIDTSGETWHQKTGIPLISWSPMARGFFTGRYTLKMYTNVDKSEDGFTKRMIEIYGTKYNFNRFRRAQELGEKKGGYTAMEIALAWVLNRPYPVAAVVGPHTIEHFKSCVNASLLRLSESEMEYLRHGV